MVSATATASVTAAATATATATATLTTAKPKATATARATPPNSQVSKIDIYINCKKNNETPAFRTIHIGHVVAILTTKTVLNIFLLIKTKSNVLAAD